MDKIKNLQAFFRSAFGVDELRRFVSYNLPELKDEIEFRGSLNKVTFELAEAIEGHQLADDKFWTRLTEARPRRAGEVQVLRQNWGGGQSSAPQTSTGQNPPAGQANQPPPDPPPEPVVEFHHFDEEQLQAIIRQTVRAGLCVGNKLDALNQGISPSVLSQIDMSGDGRTRLLNTLNHLNRARRQRDGRVPMTTWLRNATNLTFDSEDEGFFAKYAALSNDTSRSFDALDEPAPLGQEAVEGLEAKIGARNVTVLASFLRQGAAVTASVAKILVPRFIGGIAQSGPDGPERGSGTAWMIGPKLAITNFHVINSREKSLGEKDASDSDLVAQAEGATLHFGYYDKADKVEEVAVEALVAHDRKLDFAILRVAASKKPLIMAQEPIIRQVGALRDRVNVLQHPNGEPMRLGFRDNFIVSGSDKWLNYLTDTDIGSSGSPVLNDSWRVVALHRGTLKKSEGLKLPLHGEALFRQNYGIQIVRIIEALRGNAAWKPIADEIAAGQKAEAS